MAKSGLKISLNQYTIPAPHLDSRDSVVDTGIGYGTISLRDLPIDRAQASAGVREMVYASLTPIGLVGQA